MSDSDSNSQYKLILRNTDWRSQEVRKKFSRFSSYELCDMIYFALQHRSFIETGAVDKLKPFVPKLMDIVDGHGTNPISVHDPRHKQLITMTVGEAVFGRNHYNFDSETEGFMRLDRSPLNKGDFGFARLLYQLDCQTKDLRERGETEASEVANTLHAKLKIGFLEYLDQTQVNPCTEDIIGKLRTQCTNAIEVAKPELEKHRGCSNLLVNLLLMIPTLGAFMLYTGYQSGGKNFLFPFVDTESARFIKKFEEHDHIRANP